MQEILIIPFTKYLQLGVIICIQNGFFFMNFDD